MTSSLGHGSSLPADQPVEELALDPELRDLGRRGVAMQVGSAHGAENGLQIQLFRERPATER